MSMVTKTAERLRNECLPDKRSVDYGWEKNSHWIDPYKSRTYPVGNINHPLYRTTKRYYDI